MSLGVRSDDADHAHWSLSVAGAVILADGTGMTRFPTSGHIVRRGRNSRPVSSPVSERIKLNGSTSDGNPDLAPVLDAAVIASSLHPDALLSVRFPAHPTKTGHERKLWSR